MKTKFISNLKQFMFLVVAFLGTFVSYSQQPQNPSIGGSKTPSTDPLGALIFNIGGSQGAPRDNGSGMIVYLPATKTQCIFAYPNDIGGGGKGTNTGGDTGQLNDDDFDLYGVGGKNSSGGLGFLNSDIGGRGTGTSSDTGQITNPYDIGGRGDTGTSESPIAETGDGKGTDSGTGQFDFPNCPLCFDTGGGNGGKNTTGEYADAGDTGGRDSGGGLNPLNDIGGRNDTGTGAIFDTGGRTPGGIGYVDQKLSNLAKVEKFGCVLRPTYTPD